MKQDIIIKPADEYRRMATKQAEKPVRVKPKATTKGERKMFKVNDGDVVKRNGNYFKIKKTKCGHIYTSLLLGNATITAWHRTSTKKLNEHYEKVDNYTGKEKKFL